MVFKLIFCSTQAGLDKRTESFPRISLKRKMLILIFIGLSFACDSCSVPSNVTCSQIEIYRNCLENNRCYYRIQYEKLCNEYKCSCNEDYYSQVIHSTFFWLMWLWIVIAIIDAFLAFCSPPVGIGCCIFAAVMAMVFFAIWLIKDFL